MNVARNHHYVPQFLQRGFTNPAGFLERYDIDRETWKRRPTKKWGSCHDLYMVGDPTAPNDVVEKVFMQFLDDEAWVVVRALRAEGKEAALPSDAASALRAFVLTLLGRHPTVQARAEARILARIDQVMERLRQAASRSSSWNEVVADAANGGIDIADWSRDKVVAEGFTGFQIKISREGLVWQQVGLLDALIRSPERLRYRVSVVQVAPESEADLVLADLPVLVLNGRSSISAAAEAFILPIDPRWAVLLERAPVDSFDPFQVCFRQEDMTEAEVASINFLLLRQARESVVASKRLIWCLPGKTAAEQIT